MVAKHQSAIWCFHLSLDSSFGNPGSASTLANQESQKQTGGKSQISNLKSAGLPPVLFHTMLFLQKLLHNVRGQLNGLVLAASPHLAATFQPLPVGGVESGACKGTILPLYEILMVSHGVSCFDFIWFLISSIFCFNILISCFSRSYSFLRDSLSVFEVSTSGATFSSFSSRYSVPIQVQP